MWKEFMTQFSFPFFFFLNTILIVLRVREWVEKERKQKQKGGDSFISTYVNQQDLPAKVELCGSFILCNCMTVKDSS